MAGTTPTIGAKKRCFAVDERKANQTAAFQLLSLSSTLIETMRPKQQTDEDELETLQRKTFGYFIHEVNPANGLVADKTEANWPASIAATGPALAAYPVGGTEIQ